MGNKSSQRSSSNLSSAQHVLRTQERLIENLNLVKASLEGNTKAVENLIVQNIADINFSHNGLTPLIAASSKGHLEIVKLLIHSGADSNAVDEDGDSSLHMALYNGHTHVAKYFINNRNMCRIDINKTNNKNQTPLHAACFKGLSEMVTLLAENGANCNATDSDGDSCLFLALANENADVFRHLIQNRREYQIDINARNNKGNTPLHLACHNGQIKNVMLLIENGANFKALDNDGDSCLFLAILAGHFDVVKYFIDKRIKCQLDINSRNSSGQTALHAACARGRLYIVKLLIESGADFNIASNSGVTPLHLACQNGHFDTVQMLIEKGADYNAVDNDGDSCLIFAITKGDIVKYLLGLNNLNVNRCNKKGETPLHFACYHGANINIAELLIERGMDCNALDNDGDSCIFVALCNGHTDIVRYLIDNRFKYNIDISQKNKKGQTLLHAACYKGLLNSVRLFIENGVNCNVTDVDGDSCLSLALLKGHTDVARYLIDHKNEFQIDINQRNKDGLTPLKIALGLEQHDMAQLLRQNGGKI